VNQLEYEKFAVLMNTFLEKLKIWLNSALTKIEVTLFQRFRGIAKKIYDDKSLFLKFK
jgi:hypothetical protein